VSLSCVLVRTNFYDIVVKVSSHVARFIIDNKLVVLLLKLILKYSIEDTSRWHQFKKN